MSAKNITTEKLPSGGFQTGGYRAPVGEGGGKHTPKRAIIDNVKITSASPKRRGTFAKSQNTRAYDVEK